MAFVVTATKYRMKGKSPVEFASETNIVFESEEYVVIPDGSGSHIIASEGTEVWTNEAVSDFATDLTLVTVAGA